MSPFCYLERKNTSMTSFATRNFNLTYQFLMYMCARELADSAECQMLLWSAQNKTAYQRMRWAKEWTVYSTEISNMIGWASK
jgi:hypothetical protein